MFRNPPKKEVWQDKAAEIAGIVLGMQFESYDDGSEDAMVDFIGRTPLGLVALEVTSTVDHDLRNLSSDVRPPAGLAGHLQYEWQLTLPWSAARPSKSDFWPELLAIVERLEEGLESKSLELFGGAVGTEEEATSPRASSIRRLRVLGFVQGSAIRAELGRTGGIYVGFGGFMPSGDFVPAVAKAIADNHKKLVATPADERHLFVWVHETNLAMTMRLLSNVGPDESVGLQGVDQVWVAPWLDNTSADLLRVRTWTLRVGEEWRRPEHYTAS